MTVTLLLTFVGVLMKKNGITEFTMDLESFTEFMNGDVCTMTHIDTAAQTTTVRLVSSEIAEAMVETHGMRPQ